MTHDQIEAMTLGQRVAVLRDGELQQCDTPQNLFRHPVNLFVAAFIGSPSMNFVEATVDRGPGGGLDGGRVHFAGVSVPVPAAGAAASDGQRPVILGVRPTALTVATPGSDWTRLTVVPDLVEDLGDERYVIFEVDAPRVDTDATRAAIDATTADDALLTPESERAHFTARLPADAPVTVGEPLELAIDPERLHLFDPKSGATLN